MPESSCTVTDLHIDGYAKVIAWPNAVDRLGKGEKGGLDTAMGVRVRIRTGDEYIVDATSIVRLTHPSVLAI